MLCVFRRIQKVGVKWRGIVDVSHGINHCLGVHNYRVSYISIVLFWSTLQHPEGSAALLVAKSIESSSYQNLKAILWRDFEV